MITRGGLGGGGVGGNGDGGGEGGGGGGVGGEGGGGGDGGGGDGGGGDGGGGDGGGGDGEGGGDGGGGGGGGGRQGKTISLLLRVMAAFKANSRPSTCAPVRRVMAEYASTFPTTVEPMLKVAALPTRQNTSQALAPSVRIILVPALIWR
jgi:hypothetical protein